MCNSKRGDIFIMKEIFLKLLLVASLFTLIFIVVLPIINIFYIQMKNPAIFIKTLKDSEVIGIIIFTFYTGLISTFIIVIVATPVAYIFARKDFYGKSFIESIFDIPVVLPHTVAGIILLSFFSQTGPGGRLLSPYFYFVDNQAGVILAMIFISLPFYLNYTKEGFYSVDKRLENIARSLGAGELDVILTVTLPLSAHHIFTGAYMSWARAISEFGAIVVIAYFPIVLPTLIYERYVSFGLKASQPISIITIIVALFLFAVFRYTASLIFYRIYKGDRDR